MSWLNDWGEAARRPRRTLTFMGLAGLVTGGLIGYFRFGHSLGWAVTAGLACAVILAVGGWRSMHDAALIRPSGDRHAARGQIAKSTLPLAVLFLTIPVALAVGLATGSAVAFVVALAIGLAATFVLRTQ